jgi:hypothetical protein
MIAISHVIEIKKSGIHIHHPSPSIHTDIVVELMATAIKAAV